MTKTKQLKAFIILGFSLALLFLIILFTIAFNQHLQLENLKYQTNNLKEQISIYWHPVEKGLFNKTINGITIYSDINNFTRINLLMGKLNVSNVTYKDLNWIVYYQGLIDKYYEKDYPYKKPTYFEHNFKISCDGSYDEDPPQIELYRCDGTIGERLNVSVDEGFILLHELGHYFYNTNDSYQQNFADEYAKDKFNGGK